MAFSGRPVAYNPATGAMEPLSNITGISNLYFVRVATAAALTASYNSGAKTLTNSGANAAISIDGVTLSASDKVLVKNQATGSQNGLYTVTTVGDGSTPWVLTRSIDMDTGTEVEERDWFWASEGSTNADNGFTLTTPGAITLDSTSLTFSRTLGSATGSGQPASAALTDLADIGVVSAADKFHYSTATGVWAEGTVTAAGRALLDDANASDQRTTLGLGTAAVANTGTSAGNIPVLDGSGRLPAVNASQLTDLAPYIPDAWEEDWTASANTLATDGWTAVGSPTDAADTIGGITCRTITPPAGSSASYVYKTMASPPNGSFEWRALIYLPAGSATVLYSINFSAGSSGINKRSSHLVDTNGIGWFNSGGSLVTCCAMGGLVGRWIWLTVRVFNGNSGTGKYQIWLGGVMVDSGPTNTTTWRALTTAGRFEFGKMTAAAGTGVMGIARLQFRNGINQAPPDYTFRALEGEVGP